MKQEKVILHLCADTGSDTKPYVDAGYKVVRIGKEIGVENFDSAAIKTLGGYTALSLTPFVPSLVPPVQMVRRETPKKECSLFVSAKELLPKQILFGGL